MGEATWESRGIPLGNDLTTPCSVHQVLGICKGQEWNQEMLSKCMLNGWMNQ